MANKWEAMETVKDFSILGSQVTADGDCSHEIKSHLLLARKSKTNLDSILKSKAITLPTQSNTQTQANKNAISKKATIIEYLVCYMY